MTAQRARSRALVTFHVLLLLTLTGCGEQESAALVSSAPYSGPTANASVATRSTSDRIETVSGGTRSLSITFNSSDDRALTNLRVTTDLTRLPAGWRAPASFSCANVTTGSGCVLNLTYAPTAGARGTFAIDYSYTNSLGQALTGRESVDYSATTNNNIVATAAPTGQVAAIAGEGSQPVNVTFTTDDGFSASTLEITTALASLPPGWSASNATFGCDVVSTGNGCQLPLTYAPGTGANGTLALSYSYQDNSGAGKSGSINIAYAGTTRNNVNSTVTPSGQIAAVIGSGGRPVTVTFVTDDGRAGSALHVTTSLTSLPAGWSASSPELDCDSVSTGNGCQLSLLYAPTAPASGTLTFNYTYRDNVGTSKNGSTNIAYTATTSNNINGAVAPSGQIIAVVGGGSQPVNISFTPDDANPVSQFVVTTDLSALPSGWSSSASALSCATVSTVLPCDLSLTFSPSIYGAGTLTLNYSYRDHSGFAKTGAVTVPYSATVNNNIAATVSPSPLATHTGQTQTVTIAYATDDGNPATNLSVTNLATLPTGWSGPSNFTCATVTGNNSCQLSLTYVPMLPATGTLVLGFNYRDNAGTLKSGTATLNYSSENHVLYLSHTNTWYLSRCELDGNGLLEPCTAFGGNMPGRSDLAYHLGRLHFSIEQGGSDGYGWTMLGSGGTFFTSAYFGTVTDPTTVSMHPAVSALFVRDTVGLRWCPVSPSTGNIFSCSVASVPPFTKLAFTANGTRVYGAYNDGLSWRLQTCDVDTTGGITGCFNTGINTGDATMAVQIVGNRLYSMRDGGGLLVCPINSNDTIGVCVDTALGETPVRAAFTSTNAYLTTNDVFIRRCPIRADGTLGACVTMTDPHFDSTRGITLQ